ncbi:C45 family autoproteolytic acyltransferase/hydolase [Butyrivibrio sp. NC3005]|uniref:C45 family autoproteolytic acyltransferase/hydolase n=1 Tax=Butyrivibrio sp. NC3005 TaxID=1280685 RepID=UPI000410A82F|nr:C45 family autoproteolytic acyltransferase/hydolase [Butyrivibrio sp. NC3005]
MIISGKRIKTVKVKGNSYSRGYEYGEICKKEIKENIRQCIELCRSYRKINKETLFDNADKFIPALKKYDKSLLEEIQGIANGAGVSLKEIVLLNVKSELMNQLWGINSLHEGCSTFSIKTDNGKRTFLAQTWDWIKDASERMIILVEKR